MDLTVAVVALALTLPLMAVVAILVKLGGPGPVIFRRRVAGRHGFRFDAFKFRTMIDGADAVLAGDSGLREAFSANYKLESDPRVTPVGKALRKFSIDELPQLLNVLRGQMSIVGPRMLSPDELSRYGEQLSTVLAVKPGLTGPWQVSGRHRTAYERRVELDVQYVQRWSLLRDVAILVRTPFVVLKGTGI